MKKSEVITLINPLFLKGVAHRGLHNKSYCENSILAFKNAVDNNLAFELDVHLSKDDELIVCHDSSLKRVTNKEGIIEELTLKEIKENYRLLDNTKIPTLKEVLEMNDEKVPIVIELKPYKKNYKKIAKKVSEELKNVKDKRNFILISFYPQTLTPFKKEKFIRCLLLLYKRKFLFVLRHFFEGLDVEYLLFKDKKYQNEHKKRLILTWTINDLEKLELVKNYVDSITFEDIDPSILKK